MFSIRVTEPDGSTRTVAFDGAVATVGRHADNTVALGGDGISGRHCQFELIAGAVVLEDRGSTNGTFVHNRRVDEPLTIPEGTEIWVGSTKLELVALAPATTGAVVHRPLASTGPLLAIDAGNRRYLDMHGKLSRVAHAWDSAGRPDPLTLRRDELQAAQRWLAEPEDRTLAITRLQRELVAASRRAVGRRRLKRAVAGLGAAVSVTAAIGIAIALWPDTAPVRRTVDGGTSKASHNQDDNDNDNDNDDKPVRRVPKATLHGIEHRVIPQEQLEDIARRYGVNAQQIADDNAVSRDAPLAEEQLLRIERPTRRPLPQQRILYEIEQGEASWMTLAERFDVSPARLRAYNDAKFSGGPVVGETIKVWIDPKPYRRKKDSRTIAAVDARQDAIATGHPNLGSLLHGIEMPASDNYIRRYPRLMYGNAYLVSNLQRAIAAFRRDIAWQGELVLADISRKSGGYFPPHKSHQAGRDIDIWLPTLRGVFKSKYLTEGGEPKWGRRPEPEEVDWFATFGLIEALADTGAVQNVFLDKTLHPTLRRAGREMGADEAEVDKIFKPAGGVVGHSPAHVHHIHVRFKCAPWEKPGCKPNPTAGVSP